MNPVEQTEAPPQEKAAAPSRATWRIVLALALPVLAQQFLVLTVSLSDRLLAGRFQALSPGEQAEAAGHGVIALGQLANCPPGGGMPVNVLAAVAPWELARHTLARQVSYQAAQTTANYLAWFLSSYIVLVSVGSTALVARFTGAGDQAARVHATNQSILLAVVLGLAGSAGGLVSLEGLISLLQLHGDAHAYATEYLRPLLLLLTFQVVESAGIACLVGAGDTRTGLFVMMGVAVVNLPLAWGLCLGWGPLPALGFSGIALGTALSHTLGGVVVLTVLARGRFGLTLHLPLLWPNVDLLRRLLRISVPAAIDSLSIVVGQFWFLSIVNRLGDVASGAHGIALGWEALAFLSGAAFGTAAMTLVGQNLGAGRPAQAARSGWTAFGMGCGVMCFMGLVFFVLANPMFALFCPHPSQQPIVEEGVPVLRLVAFATPPMASAIIFTWALRGAGDTRVPVLFTWIGFLGVRIPLAYFLALRQVDLGPLGIWQGAGLGLFGAWLAMFADLLVRGCFFLWRFRSGAWQRMKV
ncbi:MAG TPA: MATE family efflux transporter [Gemmataceae bacterium]|nr:MATE family efflux transporter [Gemmataceae bacterium]